MPLIPLAACSRSRPPRPLRRGLVAALFAVLGHGLFVALLLFFSLLQLNVPDRRPRQPSARPVVLRGITPEQWAQNRGAPQPNVRDERTARREPKAEEKKKPKPQQDPAGQVVDVAPGNDQVNPDSKFISESNNSVAKETRAKEQTAFYRNAAPRRTSPRPQEGDGRDAVEKAQVAGNLGLGQDDRPLREAAPERAIFELPDQKAHSEVAMREPASGPGAQVSNRAEAPAIAGNSTRLKVRPGTEGGAEDASAGRAGNPGALNLLPSPAVLDKIAGAAANDHLKDLDEGDSTFLNTREWKYASFFNRVKQSVGMHWNPGAQLHQRDPTGNIYGGRDRYTVLAVTLNDRGNVKEIYVEKSCGVDFLDLEAIQSFERAQPFPNPPPGLIKADAAVHFSFGFFLEMSGTPRMRLFRSNN